MPHLTIEITDSVQVDERQLLSTVNQALFATGQFKLAKDIKSRIHRPKASLIGLSSDDGEQFVAARLAIMAGRDDDIKHALVMVVMTALQNTIAPHNANVQYTVDLVELSPYYQKAIV